MNILNYGKYEKTELERARKKVAELREMIKEKEKQEFLNEEFDKRNFVEFVGGEVKLKNGGLNPKGIHSLIKGSNKKNGKTILQFDKYEDDVSLPLYRVKDIHGEVLAAFSFEDQRNSLLYLINRLDVLDEFIFIDSEGNEANKKFDFSFIGSLFNLCLSQALSIYTSAKHDAKVKVVLDEKEGEKLCKSMVFGSGEVLSSRISHFIHYIGLLSEEIKMEIKNDLKVPSLNLELVGRIEKDSEEKIIVIEINKI